MKEEEELLGLRYAARYVSEVANLWQAVVDVWIALLFDLVEVRRLVHSKSSADLLVEAVHDSRGQIGGDLLRRGLADGSFENRALKLGRLDKFIDHVERAKREQLLLIAVLVCDILKEEVLDCRAHEALRVVCSVLLIDDQKLNQGRRHRHVASDQLSALSSLSIFCRISLFVKFDLFLIFLFFCLIEVLGLRKYRVQLIVKLSILR